MYLQNIIPITHSPTKQLRTYFTTFWWFDLSFFGNLLNHSKSVEFQRCLSKIPRLDRSEVEKYVQEDPYVMNGLVGTLAELRFMGGVWWRNPEGDWRDDIFLGGRWFKDRFWRTVESWENPGRLVVVKFWEGGTMLEFKENTQKDTKRFGKFKRKSSLCSEKIFTIFGRWSTQTFFSH